MEETKIIVTDEALRAGAAEGMDGFLKVFIDKYLEVTSGRVCAETMPLLNGYQQHLVRLSFFPGRSAQGGFIQLIQNGYGPYIFRQSFCESDAPVRSEGFLEN